MQKKTKRIIILTILILIILIISILILTKSKQMPQTLNQQAQAQYTTTIGEQVFDITNAVTQNPNPPTISAGMIPVKWDGTYWTITSADDENWYDYSNGQPAYIMLNDGTYQSELVQDMTNKKLAEEGAQILNDELGTIYMWVPRFAYNEQGEILHIKQACSVAGTWTMPEIFTYETDKKDFSLAGVWVEYNPLASKSEVTTKINNMSGEENTYGFIANTKSVAMTQNDLTAIEKYSVGAGLASALNDPTNLNRTILKITNTNEVEPIKAKAYYDEEEEKIKIEVTYRTHAISKILDENGKILSQNSWTADTGEELIGNKVYKYIVVDNKNNQKEITVEVTGLDIYIIANEQDLKLFRDAVNAGKTSSSTIANQIADVYMNKGKYTINEETGEITFAEDAEKWTPIGKNSSYYYKGDFYGNNHTISGIYGSYGLFNYCDGAQISDLGITESYMNLSGRGALLGYAKGNTIIENCYSEATIEVTGNKVGGLVGETYNSSTQLQLTINGCYNKGKMIIVGYRSNIGGIVGYGYNTKISNCYNNSEFINNNNATISTSSGSVGGIAGTVYYGEIKNCYNIADINGAVSYVGGIAGISEVKISNCYNTGKIIGYANIGGICGRSSNVSNSYNAGDIIGREDQIGGIAGHFYIDQGYTSTNLYNYGNVSSEGDSVGGIAGHLGWNNVTLKNTYNMGNITGAKKLGGIVGDIGRATVSYSYNTGEVTGTQNVGGIGGYISGSAAGTTTYYSYITNSYNKGKVSGSSNYIGGIIGRVNYDTRIYANYSECELISTTSYMGGIVGYYTSHNSNYISGNYYKTGTATKGIGSSSSQSGTSTLDEMPTIISVVGSGFIEDANNINNGLPIISWQTDNDKLNLINGDNAFVEDTEGINGGFPLLAWQVK